MCGFDGCIEVLLRQMHWVVFSAPNIVDVNLPDAPMVSYCAGPAAPAAAPAKEEKQVAAPVIIQTAFKVKLVSFDEGKKIALIKAIKAQCEGVNLVEAKKILETLPSYIKEDVSRDQAEALKDTFEKIGAVIEVI